MTRISNRAGRATVEIDGRHVDVERASGGALPSDIGVLYEHWSEFVAWRAGLSAAPDDAVAADVSWDAPITRASQVIAVGINHPTKLAAAGLQIPTEVGVILKTASAVAGPSDPLLLVGTRVVAEVELAVILGREAFDIAPEEVLDHIAGVTVAMDLCDTDGFVRTPSVDSSRPDLVYANPCKTSPGFAPLGPDVVTLDEAGDLGSLRLTLEINGVRVQDGTVAEFVFSVEEIVSRLSQRVRLLPGDVVLTGSPGQVPGHPLSGVSEGDELVAEVVGIGRQTHTVAQLVAPRGTLQTSP